MGTFGTACRRSCAARHTVSDHGVDRSFSIPTPALPARSPSDATSDNGLSPIAHRGDLDVLNPDHLCIADAGTV
jgi:hypothetical protein